MYEIFFLQNFEAAIVSHLKGHKLACARKPNKMNGPSRNSFNEEVVVGSLIPSPNSGRCITDVCEISQGQTDQRGPRNRHT